MERTNAFLMETPDLALLTRNWSRTMTKRALETAAKVTRSEEFDFKVAVELIRRNSQAARDANRARREDELWMSAIKSRDRDQV